MNNIENKQFLTNYLNKSKKTSQGKTVNQENTEKRNTETKQTAAMKLVKFLFSNRIQNQEK